jgi:CRP/FNR family transcriptional regulator, dissimilatory nitrate respiration regulator
METKDYLKKSRLCKGLDDSELEKVAGIAKLRKLKKGEILFFEGDEATGFFLLLKGRVKVYKSSADGKEQILHQITPGQIFAEVAIFHGNHFPADCASIDNSLVAFFPKQSFLNLIEKSPQISLKIIGSLAAFLREFTIMVENLSLKEVPGRISWYLLQKYNDSDNPVIMLDITKAELAKHLGTLSETLSRGFRKLTDQEIIKVEKQKITILNLDRLTDIAEGEKI